MTLSRHDSPYLNHQFIALRVQAATAASEVHLLNRRAHKARRSKASKVEAGHAARPRGHQPCPECGARTTCACASSSMALWSLAPSAAPTRSQASRASICPRRTWVHPHTITLRIVCSRDESLTCSLCVKGTRQLYAMYSSQHSRVCVQCVKGFSEQKIALSSRDLFV